LIKQIAGVSWLEREPQQPQELESAEPQRPQELESAEPQPQELESAEPQPQELESAEPQPQGTQGIASLGGYVGGHALQRLGMGAR
jgi:DNA repair ATPase RecN